MQSCAIGFPWFSFILELFMYRFVLIMLLFTFLLLFYLFMLLVVLYNVLANIHTKRSPGAAQGGVDVQRGTSLPFCPSAPHTL